MNPIIGNIPLPTPLNNFGALQAGGFGRLLNLILNLMIVAAGIYALFNFLLAGYAFLSAGDDSKKIEGAWAKIWQSVLGLVFVAGSFILAAIFGWLIFGDPNAILSPQIPNI